jgi:cell division protein ZapA
LTKTTDVEIYGQRYSIKGEADETYIRRLAGFVDGQMRQLAEGMNTTTPSRLAVLTALNLAHQLLEAEKKRAQGEADVERRMTSLMESIEEQVPTSLFRWMRLQSPEGLCYRGAVVVVFAEAGLFIGMRTR